MNAFHNPDNLTPEQVGEGYRLLEENEPITHGTEFWVSGNTWFSYHAEVVVRAGMRTTFRTRVSAVDLRSTIIEIAKLWPGHEGVNYETTSTDNLLALIKDAAEASIKDSEFLDALRAAGVDNWDGYDIAREMLDDQ